MAYRRNNPTALTNPVVSIVIPVYNERATVEEILRRVLDADMRKEIIVVDDCSTDGTRQILENMAARQANNEKSVPAQDGGEGNGRESTSRQTGSAGAAAGPGADGAPAGARLRVPRPAEQPDHRGRDAHEARLRDGLAVV